MSNVSVDVFKMDSAPFRPVPDTSGRISIFFPSEKNAFSVVYFWSKAPYYRQFAWIFIKIQYFVFPLRFNYGFHNFWHSINWLLSLSDRSCVPNMIECILPHVHGPLVTCVLFTSLYILLCKFKSTCKFSFYGHAIMTSRRVTIFFTDSWSS